MPVGSTVIQERRKFPRSEFPSGVGVNLLQSQRSITAGNVNFSDGGVCLRLQETLEVRSLVRLQVTSASASKGKPMECTGRVAWVIQRLDLRTMPPFLFDVGIQFVDPPPLLRQLMAQRGGSLAALKGRAMRERLLESAVIRGRGFIPRLEQEANRPLRWHLIVSVDGLPCFSGHYASERAANAAWAKFKRQQANRR